MKMFVVIMSSAILYAAADPVVRFPLINPAFEQVINFHKETHPDHTVITEFQWSQTNSSVEGLPDYFVVKATSSEGARVLRMSPIQTDESGMKSAPTFTDVVSKSVFIPTLETVKNGDPGSSPVNQDGILENYFHYGSMGAGEDVINIFIGYHRSVRNPVVLLSWGSGSGPVGPGDIIDTFEKLVSWEPSTQTSLDLKIAKSVPDVEDGVYVAIASPREYPGIRLQSSPDLKIWGNENLVPLFIIGDSTCYKVTEKNISFFRAVEL